MPVSRLDVVYRKILITKFFTKGWGSPEHLQRLFNFRQIISDRDSCYKLVPKRYPITILNEIKRSDCRILEGKFHSPLTEYLPGLVPEEVQDSYFQMVLPLEWKGLHKPMCIHLAGTGDHYFWRRRNIMAKPLLKEGIGAIILENPYYGLRKPKDQVRSCLHYVSDIFVMGGCLILECLVLLSWCEQLGFGPLGVTGISMGGHMASLAASNWPRPLVLVPCLSWSSASSVFTEGVMSDSIDWEMLQAQYESNGSYSDDLSKICKIVDNPFTCDLRESTELSHLECSGITPHQLLDVMSSKNIILEQSPTHSVEYSLASKFKEQPLSSNQMKRGKEAFCFMRGMMDECTHLKNFSVPHDTSLIISICAKADGYVPRVGLTGLEDIWPGVIVKYVDCGHVGAYIWHRKIFREAIVEAFERAKQKIAPPSPAIHEI